MQYSNNHLINNFTTTEIGKNKVDETLLNLKVFTD